MRYLRTAIGLCVLLSQLHAADKVTFPAAGKHDDSLYGKKGRTLLIVESQGRKGRLWNQGRYHGGLTLMRTAFGSGGAVMILDGDNDAYVYPAIESPSAENENAGEFRTTEGDSSSILAAVEFVNSDDFGVRLSAKVMLQRLAITKTFDRVLLYTDGDVSCKDGLAKLTAPIHLFTQVERLSPMKPKQISKPVVTLANDIQVASITAFKSKPSAGRSTWCMVWTKNEPPNNHGSG